MRTASAKQVEDVPRAEQSAAAAPPLLDAPPVDVWPPRLDVPPVDVWPPLLDVPPTDV
jgi:hypothetical protein